MTLAPSSDRDRRALLIGITVILGVLGLSKGVPRWMAWRADLREAAEVATGQLALVRGALMSLPATLDTAEARVAQLRAFSGQLLVVRDDAEAARQVRGLVEEAARVAGIVLEVTEVTSDSTRRPTGRITIRARGAGDVVGVKDFLLRLEGGGRFVSVRNLSIETRDLTIPDDGMETLSLDLILDGLSWIRPIDKVGDG